MTLTINVEVDKNTFKCGLCFTYKWYIYEPVHEISNNVAFWHV